MHYLSKVPFICLFFLLSVDRPVAFAATEAGEIATERLATASSCGLPLPSADPVSAGVATAQIFAPAPTGAGQPLIQYLVFQQDEAASVSPLTQQTLDLVIAAHRAVPEQHLRLGSGRQTQSGNVLLSLVLAYLLDHGVPADAIDLLAPVALPLSDIANGHSATCAS